MKTQAKTQADIKQTILTHNRAVPRYTSYPTAPHFRDGFTDTAYRNWLEALMPDQTLSLYVHVPFCPKLCWFCGCNTKITRRDAPVDEYADLLKREMAMVGAHVARGARVTHLHFGGGSPTMLKPEVFESVLATLRAQFVFDTGAEIAVEIDPRNLTDDLAAAYGQSGVTRVSFGVQDFDDKVMKAVNREQSYDLVAAAADRARKAGIAGLNVDVMYGLPYQNETTMHDLAQKVVSLSPDRIALFGYAHVPWMKKHMRLIPEQALPDNDLRFDLFEIGAAALEEAGYIPVGIDHFARPDDDLAKSLRAGTMRRNFQGYTTDTADALLGFGSSAIGHFPQGYVQNTIHAPQYRDRVLSGRLPVEKFCELSVADRLRADVIEHLICYMRVDLADICKRHALPLTELAPDIAKLEKLESGGLVRLDGTVVSVSARQMARLACAAFDTYLAPPAENLQRHVTAV